MAYAFDSLGYAKRLRGGGVPRDQAEAHAEAAGDFIMAELATKADLLVLKRELQNSIAEVRAEIHKPRSNIADLAADFRDHMDKICLEVTVWFGVMCAGLVLTVAVLRLSHALHPR